MPDDKLKDNRFKGASRDRGAISTTDDWAAFFEISNDAIPVPPDLFREARSRARYRKAPRPGERITLDAALFLAMRSRWRTAEDKWKRYQQSDATIRMLARLKGASRLYVDAVTEADLRALIARSIEQGLSPGAVKYRLSCLSALGVKVGVWQIASPSTD